MLQEASIMRSECFITSLVRTMIPHASIESVIAQRKADVTPMHVPYFDKMVLLAFVEGVKMLEKEIDLVKPKVVVVAGNGALFALTGKWGSKSWRGSELDFTTKAGTAVKVVPIYPPSYILAVWKDRGITVQDLRRVRAIADGKQSKQSTEFNFLIRPGFSVVVKTLNELLAKVEAAPTKLSVDIETRGGHTACTGIAWSRTDAICIPHMVSGNQNYWLEEEEAFIVWKMYKLLTHPNAIVVGQNFLYDAQYFYRHFHFIPNLVRDTMIGHHAMFSKLPKGLDYLSSMYCEEHVYWKSESKNWDPKLGEDQLWIYNCKDCCITYEVDDAELASMSKLVADGWTKLPEVFDFQQSLFWPVLDSMIKGIRVDHTSRERLSRELLSAIEARNSWLDYVVDHPLNIKSPKQMCDFFYRELAQKEIKNHKTGSQTCDDAALEKIGNREPLLLPLLETVAELRSLGVFRSTFIEAPVDSDDRMRSSFNIAGTASYRFSSSENAFGSGMNLQNIPVGDEDGTHGTLSMPNVRKLFLPDPEHEFFDIDLDSADLRIVVAEANVPEMRFWLDSGLKPYVEVAKEYYKDASIDKTHPSYKFFKAFCHATHYLGTPSGMADRINQHARMYGLPSMSVGDIAKLQEWYFGKFPEISLWHDKVKTQVAEKKYVENVFGYRIYFFDRIEGNIFNEAVALIPQSTVACLINRGYRNLYENHREIQVLLQVHDSLGGQYHRDIRDSALDTITKACSIQLPYPNPITIPVGIKSSTESWGGCG